MVVRSVEAAWYGTALEDLLITGYVVATCPTISSVEHVSVVVSGVSAVSNSPPNPEPSCKGLVGSWALICLVIAIPRPD
ncbi:hypothetical protein APICC_00931 [Apis cerana cerana]|uniref:Uncharacterized protein n=1 Tax=Apis cerana cerana TaxID=94128 RepID=A0A2A3E6X4_APICC|nr:hypothetical protein APICC_00931 [Apis cerana cerana]